MAALLLSCVGIMSSKFASKRRARKERQEEYDSNFESLKEQNANRVRQLSSQGSMEYNNNNINNQGPFSDDHRASLQSHAQPEMRHEPPKYDDIVQRTEVRHSG